MNIINAVYDESNKKVTYRHNIALAAWSAKNHCFLHVPEYGYAPFLAEKLLSITGKEVENGLMERLLFYARVELGDEPHGIKKNGRQMSFNRGTGRPVLGKSAVLVRAERMLIAQLQLQAREQRITAPFEGRFHLMVHFYFPKERIYTKAGKVSETIPDLSNLIELPQDCMQPPKICQSGKRKGKLIKNGAGIISNDSHIDSLDGSRRIPSESYRLELFLFRHRGLINDGTNSNT